MLSFEEILTIVKGNCRAGEPITDPLSTPPTIVVAASDLLDVCQQLHTHSSTYFDLLSCVTGVDNGPQANTMEVIYHLYSIPFDHRIVLKVVLDRMDPQVKTVSGIWRTANWHEREIFDLFGIKFVDHPDLRRILLPADWIGHPLRKDYKTQDYYHGIKYDY